MDLGASVCTRSKPRCEQCPLRDQCVALREQRIAQLPVRRSKPALPQRETHMLLALDAQQRLLLTRRPPTGIWPSLWSLPQVHGSSEAEQWLSAVAHVGAAPQQLGEPLLHRSEEHTSELQSLMRISYAVFCLKKKNKKTKYAAQTTQILTHNTQQAKKPTHETHPHKALK